MKKILSIVLSIIASTGTYAQIKDVPVCNDEVRDTIAVDSTAISEKSVLSENISITDKQKVLNYIRSVYDKAVYTQNISTGIDLGLKGMGHNINIDGKLQMRRNAVIRISVTPFGLMEAARLEFTPTYVLFMDRIHKEYVKTTYDKVSFLKAEGLDFYTLQSLFWNELFQPGKQKLTDKDLNEYTADISNPKAQCMRYKTPDMLFRWNTDTQDHIIYAGMTYGYTGRNYSTVKVNYGNFTPLGVKQFPQKLYVTFTSRSISSGSLSINMDMKGVSTDSDWEAETTVSDRYTQVSVEDFFKKIGSL